MQTPIIAIQSVVSLGDLPLATAITLFFNQLGSSVFITVAQATILGRLLPRMQAINPNLSRQDIVQAGATGLKQLVTESQIPEVLEAYAVSVDAAFYVAAGIMAAAAVVALGVEQKKLPKEHKLDKSGE